MDNFKSSPGYSGMEICFSYDMNWYYETSHAVSDPTSCIFPMQYVLLHPLAGSLANNKFGLY